MLLVDRGYTEHRSVPVYKEIDASIGKFALQTMYMYSNSLTLVVNQSVLVLECHHCTRRMDNQVVR